jgi:predicted dehydrogenase
MNKQHNIGIAVIGCGGMGMAIVNRLIARDPRLQIRTLYDPNPASVEHALKTINSQPRVCDSASGAITDPAVDWVMIASWNCFHKEQSVTALNAGKHVFCQKPLATNFEDCLAMRAAWHESGRMFNIGFSLRYAPHYRKIKQLLDARVVGDIISFEFNETLEFNHGGFIMGDWRRLQANAGTHLLEKCCHDIDLANWMTGSMASRVASFGGLNFFKPENARHIERIGPHADGAPAYGAWAYKRAVGLNAFTSDKDIVDNQVAIIEYANGVRATFHANCNAGIPERRLVILGTEGAIRADLTAGVLQSKRIGFDTAIENHAIDAIDGHGGGDDILTRELADSMLHGAAPSVDLDDGLKSAATCFAIDDAMNRGQVVDVMPYWRAAGLF